MYCLLCIGMLVDDFCHSSCAIPFTFDLRYTSELQLKNSYDFYLCAELSGIYLYMKVIYCDYNNQSVWSFFVPILIRTAHYNSSIFLYDYI